MKRSKPTAEISAIAKQLGVPARGDLEDAILNRCMKKVAGWVDELGPVSSLPGLLELVQAKLLLRFEVVAEHRDIERIRKKYLAAGELGFVDLDREFERETDAIVLRLERAAAWSDCHYVAVVDGRGWRASRVWFSKWHEIAHLLAEPQTSFVFRRTETTKRDSVERLMDRIGGELAFYELLFLPALMAAGINLEGPRLSKLCDFHARATAFASLHATLNAAIRHVLVPTILVEAQLGYKRGQRTNARLRAVTTAHNPSALQRRFYIHRNMRVPEQSVIHRVFAGDARTELEPFSERLSWWESEGNALPDLPITVEAMKAGSSRVLALVCGASDSPSLTS